MPARLSNGPAMRRITGGCTARRVGSAGCYIREKKKGYRRRSRPAAKKKMDEKGVFGFVRDTASVEQQP